MQKTYKFNFPKIVMKKKIFFSIFSLVILLIVITNAGKK